MKKEVKTAEFHRRNILSSITAYLATQQYDDILITSNFNEDIHMENIKAFFRINSLQDAHSIINNHSNFIDNT